MLWIRTLLRSLAAEGRTVLVSSHLMSEMALTADYLIVIGRGRLLADTTVDELVRQAGGASVKVITPQPDYLRAHLTAPGVEITTATTLAAPLQELHIRGTEAAHIGAIAAAHGITLHELTPQTVSLEQAFMDLTQDAADHRSQPPATTTPTRLPVLWAKAAVFTATVLTVMSATALTTFIAAQLFLHDTDQTASLTDPGVLRAPAGNAVGITLLSLIALGLGSLLRSVPGAIGAFIGGVMILPEVLGMLPYETVERALVYFPTQAAGALGSATPIPGTAAPGPALLALCLWATATLAAAALALRYRDA
ncbi:hypothetical protein ACPCUK_29710 [Streptomyces arboris]|uniref:hypothetical protein n=1 Tax=Streptomyces arboris TaxID=2600619 RepID=UPI003C2CBF9E